MKISPNELHNYYVCPKCKSEIIFDDYVLKCSNCLNQYKFIKDIIDFVPTEYWKDASNTTILKKAYSAFFNFLGPIYESDFWYQWTLNMSGAKGNSIHTIHEFIENTLKDVKGNIVDIACGTATYSRRISNESRNIFGLDFSLGMLEQGQRYIEKLGIKNVHLVQGTADYLPFKNEFFDGAINAGSLHLFNDPQKVLKEIRRVLKPASKIALQTFISTSNKGKKTLKEKTGFHFFDPDSLKSLLVDAGFVNIEINQNGTVLYGRAIVNK